MNTYIFSNASTTTVRVIWLESDEDGMKSVADILEMNHSGTEKSLKNTVKCLYEMMFIGEKPGDNPSYEIVVHTGNDEKKSYDASLAGKARKQSSKDINVISAMLLESGVQKY